MNEVFETLSSAFESLCNDRGGREYYVQSEECRDAEKVMNALEKEFDACKKTLPEDMYDCLTEYLDAMAQYHFKEEQRAYYQGLVDSVMIMGGLGLLRENIRVKKILDKMIH